MKCVSVIVPTVVCINCLGCVTDTTLDHWQAKAATVPIGSTRTQVEKILPPMPMTPILIEGPIFFYWVAETTQVTAIYDGTNGTLSHPIRVERKPAPVVTIKKSDKNTEANKASESSVAPAPQIQR